MGKKKYIVILLFMLCAMTSSGQGKFDPGQFRSDLHEYIEANVNLTASEKSKFFPVFDEMRDKLLVVFKQIRALHRTPLKSEQQAAQLIYQVDKLEIQLKTIEQAYHIRLLKTVPATKLCDILRAERRFHRQELRKFAGK